MRRPKSAARSLRVRITPNDGSNASLLLAVDRPPRVALGGRDRSRPRDRLRVPSSPRNPHAAAVRRGGPKRQWSARRLGLVRYRPAFASRVRHRREPAEPREDGLHQVPRREPARGASPLRARLPLQTPLARHTASVEGRSTFARAPSWRWRPVRVRAKVGAAHQRAAPTGPWQGARPRGLRLAWCVRACVRGYGARSTVRGKATPETSASPSGYEKNHGNPGGIGGDAKEPPPIEILPEPAWSFGEN
jgi:hypothetical protein